MPPETAPSAEPDPVTVTAAPCLAEVWIGDKLVRCSEAHGHGGSHAARFPAATDNPYRDDADVEVTWKVRDPR